MTRIVVLTLLLVFMSEQTVHSYNTRVHSSRREWIHATAVTPFVAAAALASAAGATTTTTTGSIDGNLPELPPEAVRSYLQYRMPLQVRRLA